MTFPIIPASTVSGSYQISRSLRFRSSASAYLSRTPSGTGSQTKWTMSFWVKRGSLSSSQIFVSAGTSGVFYLQFQANDTLRVRGATVDINTTAVFRDPSAWYSVVIVWDSANATQANRLIVYVNGISQALTTVAGVALNETSEWNSTSAHNIGRYSFNGTLYFDGYLTEFNFVNNAALLATDFGAFDTNGVWQPARYTGSYGTNGFYLNFSDNSGATATTIGKDSSGNSNNWTPNNISVTSGTTYDSMIDSPTNYADGGNGRGNYAVLNPVAISGSATLSSGNLLATTTATSGDYVISTIACSGKVYAEFKGNSFGSGYVQVGVLNAGYTNSALYRSDGTAYQNGANQGNIGSYTTSNIIGVTIDMSNRNVKFYKDNVQVGSTYTVNGTDDLYFAIVGSGLGTGNASAFVNFGQQSFTYTPPSGFSALNTQNLPTPTIAAGNKYFDVLPYTGNATLTTRAGLNLSSAPGLVWIKSRSYVDNHVIEDSVRGTGVVFTSISTAAEGNTGGGWIQNLSTTGFSTDVNTQINTNAATYVSWVWAGGSNVTNTSGSITSTVSANTSAGFSVVTYTGTGANATVGHGLGVAPSMYIVKRRDAAADWQVYHTSLGATSYVSLNPTAASASTSLAWNNTSPTSSVFSVGTAGSINASGASQVAYCFAPVAGYSAFGSYTGNGSADGAFIYTGFRPRFILFKNTSAVSNWLMLDSARNTYNAVDLHIHPNVANAETTGSPPWADFLSNGFKLRNSYGETNTSGNTYVYAAFSENPFKYSRAR